MRATTKYIIVLAITEGAHRALYFPKQISVSHHATSIPSMPQMAGTSRSTSGSSPKTMNAPAVAQYSSGGFSR
jgi:hypothetical protein